MLATMGGGLMWCGYGSKTGDCEGIFMVDRFKYDFMKLVFKITAFDFDFLSN